MRLLLLWLLTLAPPVWAGEVILHIPDSQLTEAIENACLYGIPGVWDHCEREDNGGYKTLSEKVTWMVNRILRVRQRSLEDLGATIEVRLETPPT